MKTRSLISILAVVAVFSCKQPAVLIPYQELGSFNSRVDGQNYALADILNNYPLLSPNKIYKVRYANKNARPSEARENALWYDKRQHILSMEVSPPDGPACYWENVSKDILEQAVKSNNGMLTIDSLAKPYQPANTCLR
ncbi:hypothetical protein [Spirosoma pomorum]